MISCVFNTNQKG